MNAMESGLVMTSLAALNVCVGVPLSVCEPSAISLENNCNVCWVSSVAVTSMMRPCFLKMASSSLAYPILAPKYSSASFSFLVNGRFTLVAVAVAGREDKEGVCGTVAVAGTEDKEGVCGTVAVAGTEDKEGVCGTVAIAGGEFSEGGCAVKDTNATRTTRPKISNRGQLTRSLVTSEGCGPTGFI